MKYLYAGAWLLLALMVLAVFAAALGLAWLLDEWVLGPLLAWLGDHVEDLE